VPSGAPSSKPSLVPSSSPSSVPSAIPSSLPYIIVAYDVSKSVNKKKTKWKPIISFDLGAANVGVSVNKIKVTGYFANMDGRSGKSKSCKTDTKGMCNISGKKMKTSKKMGYDESSFVLVSLKAGKIVLTPEFEKTLTWIES